MSRTDKTRPPWVQMMDPHNRGWKEEHHDHRKGPCDIYVAYEQIRDHRNTWWCLGQHASCTIWPSGLAGYEGIWARPSDTIWSYRKKDLGKVRGHKRRMIRELLKTTREDLMDYDYMPTQHRHNALWEAY